MLRYLPIMLIVLSCSGRDTRNYSDKLNPDENTEVNESTTNESPQYNENHQPNSYSAPNTLNDMGQLSAKIVYTEDLGWGYQIYNDSTMLINQLNIPAIQGNKGFKSREAASVTANYILFKLSNNIFPPTISKGELDSLGVL